MSQVGRPSEYRPEFCQQAADMCANGATDRELAEFFEISDRTLYRWKAQFPEFCQALKAGKDIADERVLRSLYHRAVGYKHDAVKIFLPKDASEPVYAPYVEYVAPDVTACIFWLKNRRKEDWRDKQEHELTGKDGGPIELTELELARRIAFALEVAAKK